MLLKDNRFNCKGPKVQLPEPPGKLSFKAVFLAQNRSFSKNENWQFF